MDVSITIHGKSYHLNEVDNINCDTQLQQLGIAFIKEWLSGKNEFLQQTSGSTGVPKPIKITRSQMIASAGLTIERLNLKPAQTALICLSPEYIAGKMMIVRCLEANMNMCFVEPSSDPFEKINTPTDFVALVPLQLNTILNNEESKKKLNLCSNVIIGGAPTESDLIDRIQSLNCAIYATYGMTETVSHIALKRLNGIQPDTYFKAFNEVELALEERGCLTIKSVLTNHELITTNDIVELIDNKQFRWIGRADNTINTGGYKVQSEQVEKVVSEVFGNFNIPNRFFITGTEDIKLGQKVVLVIEGQFNPTFNFMDELKNHLSKFALPKEIYTTKKFTETHTGKIQRKETLSKIISNNS